MRVRDYLLNKELCKNSRSWAKKEAEKSIIPDWVLKKVVIDEEFMRLASENIKKSVETIKTEEDVEFDSKHPGGVIWVDIPETKLAIPILGEAE